MRPAMPEKKAPLLKPLSAVALATVALLLLPLLAMQVTDEVSWGWGDFLAAGVLLFGTVTAIVLVRRHFGPSLARTSVVAAIVLAAVLLWAELAVGLFR